LGFSADENVIHFDPSQMHQRPVEIAYAGKKNLMIDAAEENNESKKGLK
jgi:hypothetical protein